jgi:hypothetical protein
MTELVRQLSEDKRQLRLDNERLRKMLEREM